MLRFFRQHQGIGAIAKANQNAAAKKRQLRTLSVCSCRLILHESKEVNQFCHIFLNLRYIVDGDFASAVGVCDKNLPLVEILKIRDISLDGGCVGNGDFAVVVDVADHQNLKSFRGGTDVVADTRHNHCRNTRVGVVSVFQEIIGILFQQCLINGDCYLRTVLRSVVSVKTFARNNDRVG